MKAIIMAGGFGTRLRAVTGEKPKPMAELLGKPIMEHIVDRLRLCGYKDICAALKYRAEDIMDYFGDGERFGVRMQYRIESEPLGTAGAVKNCADFYGEDDFLVISGDAACDFDLRLLMRQHQREGAAVSVALCRDSVPLRYGLAVCAPDGRIHSFIEKPDWPRVVTDRVNTGIYIISPRAMAHVPPGQNLDFGRDVFPALLRSGEKLLGIELPGYWCDIGTPLSYYQCCVDAIEGRLDIDVPEEFQYGTEPEAKAVPVQPGDGDFCGAEARRGTEPAAENPLIRQPSGLQPSPQGEGFKGTEILIRCADRAGLMDRLSAELMELGADYSQGIAISGGRLRLSIRPAADISALRLSVHSADAEFARDMLARAREAIEETEKAF